MACRFSASTLTAASSLWFCIFDEAFKDAFLILVQYGGKAGVRIGANVVHILLQLGAAVIDSASRIFQDFPKLCFLFRSYMKLVDTVIAGNAENPWAEGIPEIEAFQGYQDSQEYFLNDIFSIVKASQGAVYGTPNHGMIPFYEFGKSMLVAPGCSLD